MKRISTYALACIAATATLLPVSCNNKPTSATGDGEPSAQTVAINTLTEEERAAGWELLFDGATLDGWKRYNHDTIGPLWSVVDGAIVCDGKGLTEGTAGIGGSLITTREFGNFELMADWKVSPGGNSGILYHVVEGPSNLHDYVTGPEYQVLDDKGWTGGELTAAQLAGSNYDMFPAKADKKLNPAGEWNTAKIVYNDGHVEHWLNGEKVVEFEENSDAFRENYQKSKWVEYPEWNKAKKGAISLQDHGAPVYFRNIRIREL